MSEISEGKKVKSILFVDDDKVQHMINKRILLGVNPDLDLHFYANPVDALEWLKKNKADVMLLDINMPEMNGWEFLDKIRKEGITSDVKMLSSSIDPEDEVRSKQYDMVSGFLIKPLSKEVLIKALKL